MITALQLAIDGDGLGDRRMVDVEQFWVEQFWIEKNETRCLWTGKRERLFLNVADRVDDSGIGVANVRKKRFSKLSMDAALVIFGEQRTHVRCRHANSGESGRLGAIVALRCEHNAGIDQRA